jgi:hypothetical protein
MVGEVRKAHGRQEKTSFVIIDAQIQTLQKTKAMMRGKKYQE